MWLQLKLGPTEPSTFPPLTSPRVVASWFFLFTWLNEKTIQTPQGLVLIMHLTHRKGYFCVSIKWLEKNGKYNYIIQTSLQTPEEEGNKTSRLPELVSVGEVVIVLAGHLASSLRNVSLCGKTELYYCDVPRSRCGLERCRSHSPMGSTSTMSELIPCWNSFLWKRKPFLFFQKRDDNSLEWVFTFLIFSFTIKSLMWYSLKCPL